MASRDEVDLKPDRVPKIPAKSDLDRPSASTFLYLRLSYR
jgi:hypothetical protein